MEVQQGTVLSVVMFLLSTSNDYIDMKVDLVVVGASVEGLAGCILQWCLAIGYEMQST